MRLNRKLEIGMNIVALLKGKNTPTRVVDMASSVGTTEHFLEQIMRNLREAEIVSVKRGPGGGYTLSKTSVTAYDVAKAVGREFETVSFDEAPASRLKQSIVEAFEKIVI